MTTSNNINFTDKTALKAFILHILDEAKALDIVTHDFPHNSDISDIAIICSGRSSRHTQAIAHQIEEALREQGLKNIKIQGDKDGEWLLIDFGSIVVHMMQPQVRDYYQLEDLWKHREK